MDDTGQGSDTRDYDLIRRVDRLERQQAVLIRALKGEFKVVSYGKDSEEEWEKAWAEASR